MKPLGCAALALAGCNSLLALDPGSPVGPASPSCTSGWTRRIPIDIDNNTAAPLLGYQVAIPLDARTLPQLRFGTGTGAPPPAFAVDSDLARIWIAVPTLPPGRTRIYAYYDNLDADPWTPPSPFEAGLIANPSFESTGAWTIETSATRVQYEYSTQWASDGTRSLGIDAFRYERPFFDLDYGFTQRVRFPPGSDYVLRFDLAVVAASNGGVNSSGEFFVSIGDGLVTAWRKSGDEGNITGIYRDVETIPVSAGDVGIMFGVTLRDGTSAAFAKGFYDNVRVRKHITPEPTVSVGTAQDACGS